MANLKQMDIIKKLSKDYDFYPPIFIDFAGEITNIAETENQQIRLYAKKE